ncbi:MAG: hypothetical protein ACLR56_12235 [Oscillospiraceae bacterium]
MQLVSELNDEFDIEITLLTLCPRTLKVPRQFTQWLKD